MNQVLTGDALTVLKTLPDESVQCCVTSPPYWGLRDYGVSGQLGLEKTPEEYVEKMVAVFREVKRVLKSDGVLWLNLGDSYAGSGGSGGDYAAGGLKEGQPKFEGTAKLTRKSFRRDKADVPRSIGAVVNLKPKDLVGIPWLLAFALRADGWYLRSDIIWAKPNPMPESVTDRPTKSHEYIFLLTKSGKCYYDQAATKTPLAKASHVRLGQDIDNQKGSDRVPGKTNGPMKAVSFGGANGREYKANIQPDDPNYRNGSEQWGRNYVPTPDLMANIKSVWHIATQPRKEAHFATFPDEIPEICIKAGSKKGDTILDPFAGSGTTLQVAKRLGREFIGIELSEKYVTTLIEPSLEKINPLFAEVNP